MNERNVETLIVGAGPAGLQLAYFLSKRERDYLVLERESPGAFFKSFPRHRMLISINKVYTGYDDPEKNMRWDWNSLLSDDPSARLSRYSDDYFPAADDLVRYLDDFVRDNQLRIETGTSVNRIAKVGDDFQVTDDQGRQFRMRWLVMATGVHKPYLPAIEGIELGEPYTSMSTDRKRYRGKRILIVGKGNSAFETANHLVGSAAVIHLASPHPLKLAWKTRFVGDLRAINNHFLDTYRLKSQNVVIDANVVRMTRSGDKVRVLFDYVHAPGETEEFEYDHVLLCTGFRFDGSAFDDSARPELCVNDRFPKLTNSWESANVPNLYFAGALMQSRDFKRCMSAFIHGFRYNVRTLFHLMEERHYGVPLPSIAIHRNAKALTEATIRRVNTSSGLWQMPGFLADAIVGTGSEVRRLEELPMDWIHETDPAHGASYFTVTLEFGPNAADPFDFERPHRDAADLAPESEALHPVVRRWRRGKLLSTHHAMEDIAADWSDAVHVNPLERYFERELGDGGAPQAIAEGAAE